MPSATETKKVVVPKVALPRETNHQNNSSPNGNNDQEVYSLMERRDEQQIMESIKGNYLEEYVYQFRKGGREISGLSWIGTQEAAREYGGIQVPIDKIREKETEKHIIITVEAVHARTGSSRLGRSKQAKRFDLRDPEARKKYNSDNIEDEFADIKALSKAQRNAIRALLPQTWIKEFIKTKLAETEDTKDPATKNSTSLICSSCQVEIAKVVADYSLKYYGFALCRDCQQAHQK